MQVSHLAVQIQLKYIKSGFLGDRIKLGNWFWEFPVRERIVLRTVWNSKSEGMTRTKDIIVMGNKRQWTDAEWLKAMPEMPVLLQVTP